MRDSRELTSMGLVNDILISIGPAVRLKVVRVGVNSTDV